MGASLALQHKAFSCECAASELVSSVVLLYYLGRGSANRHVFDLDGVCHVGEMISAPADVLKGAAGKVNRGAKAKSRPEIHTSAHEYILCKHHAGNVCVFSYHITRTKQHKCARSKQNHRLFSSIGANTRPFSFFLNTYSHTRHISVAFPHTRHQN